MLTKQSAFDLKDLDEKTGTVIAYANAYNNEDSDGDISAPGSFSKTVSENSKRIRVLKDHDRRISLGVPKEMNASDPYGLLTTTQFNMQKEVSRDMFTDIQLMKEHGLNAELSIGYDIVARDDKDMRIIKEYKLWEYSFLTSWAANELATVGDIKNIKSTYGILELIEKAYDLKYSDPRLKQIEELLKTLTLGPSADTRADEPEYDQTLIEQIKNSFKL